MAGGEDRERERERERERGRRERKYKSNVLSDHNHEKSKLIFACRCRKLQNEPLLADKRVFEPG